MSRERLLEFGWYKKGDDHIHWFHKRFGHEPMTYDEACATLKDDTPEGMMDWNNQPMEFYAEVLEKEYRFSSSGVAKAAFELIKFYRANKDRDPNRTENKLFKIEDHWSRHNVETNRLIAEGANHVNGLFTIDEAEAYIKTKDVREEIPNFSQYRVHEFKLIPVDNNPLI
jgi:hypothetical protein